MWIKGYELTNCDYIVYLLLGGSEMHLLLGRVLNGQTADGNTANAILYDCNSPAEAQALFDAITEWLDGFGAEPFDVHFTIPVVHHVFDIPRWLENYRKDGDAKETK